MSIANENPRERPRFTFAPYLPARLGALRRPLASLLDRSLGLTGLNAVYHAIPPNLDPHSFARCTLNGFGVEVRVDDGSLDNIPATGPCIVVANHPHGGLDGVAMVEVLMRRRPDLRVMANYLLHNFIELAPIFIGVDPFGGRQSVRSNFSAVRQALAWLRKGGVLFMFPGGEVSSLNLKTRVISDPPWDAGIGWLVQKSGAPVVPAFIDGRNSTLFQLGGLIHPRIRTMLLVREMLNHRGTVINVKCGRVIEAETLSLLEDRETIAPYLQISTYLIKARAAYHKPLRLTRVRPANVHHEELAAPIEPALLAGEISHLDPDQRLLISGNLQVWVARAEQIPWLLQEIGRLREVSFRQVGEGTGRSVDLDLFDSYYLHLFMWDSNANAVIGGYRLGQADRILSRYGARGLYVRTLFRLERPLEAELHSALELGRSFVRPEYQRNYSSLMLLWKGICAYVARNPKYRVLFGPVSISNDYHPLSQQLIVRFLQRNRMEPERASLVKPRQAFPRGDRTTNLVDLNVSDLRIIASLLNAVEEQDVGIPVLLRQYLKLNGRILGFNVDPEFNNSIDCLLWVDLAQTESALLRKFMGPEACDNFLRYHGATIDETGSEVMGKGA